MWRLARICALILTLLPQAAGAQDRATLIADVVSIASGSVLIAAGHVEVFFQGTHLTASRITYDRAGDSLIITGPIRIEDGAGVLFLADQAQLSADLKTGILTSARLVLNQRLQLAAAEIQRSDGGRYTALRNVVASSCKICAGSPTPLWEIRATEVVHDQGTQQIYFSGAQFRFYGLPLVYLPMLRVPDPTLTRANGFLNPRLRSTTALGPGLKLPYFLTLGPSRDLLLTPYVTTLGSHSVELRYRQAFATGSVTVNGAVTQDHLRPDITRGYAEALGTFALPDDFALTFRGILVSDKAYLLDYGISNDDRLSSQIDVTKTQRNQYFDARLISLLSVRDGESNLTLPSRITDMTYERRFEPAILGGEGEFHIDTHSHYRTSSATGDADLDGIADGRDLSRISFTGNWRRNFTTQNGMVFSALAEANADYYQIAQDAVYGGEPSRAYGTAAMEMRWPWVKAGSGGVSHLIEPVLQLVVSPRPGSALPNEDSSLVEFDEGNLFALNRFPGADAYEGGARANLGLSYLRYAPSGWTLAMTAGRVVRVEDLGQFSHASGLEGVRSDWMLAWGMQNEGGLSVTNRLLLDDGLALTKGELRLDLNRDRYGVTAGYEYLLADPVENRTDTLSELVLDARYDLTSNWSAELSNRYDLIADRSAQAALQLTFANECIDVNLSLSRRFTSSTSVKPTTDFGLSVELLGFGGASSAGPQRMCGR